MKKQLHSKFLLTLLFPFLSLSLKAQDLDWVQSMGGEKVDDSRAIALDHEGNVYIAGTIYGDADFNKGQGTNMLKLIGGADVFLAKYDASGAYQWAINMGGSGYDYGNDVTVDKHGNVYVTGYFFGKACFNPKGGDTLQAGVGFNDIFVAKYDSEGNYLWAINMGGTKQNYGYGIAVHENGDIYITGAFDGKTDFDPGPDTAFLTSSPGSFFSPGFDIYIAKYDSNGKYQWAHGIGGIGAGDYGYDIAVDRSGSAYITGYFSGSGVVDFDPGPGTSFLLPVGINDAFVAKYDKDGNYKWAQAIGSKYDDNGLGIVLDEFNNVYYTGYFSDTATLFDPGANVWDSLYAKGNNSYDLFVAKYDSAGKYLWAKTLGDVGDDIGYRISIDRVGNPVVTGIFTGTVSIDGLPDLQSVDGSKDVLLTKLNPDGDFIWARSIGGSTSSDYGYGIVCDRSGGIYATGNYGGTADLDPGTSTANFTVKGMTDIFLLKLLCSDTSSSTLNLTGCGESFVFFDSTYTSEGTYRYILPNAAGCDSIITIQLTLINPQPVIAVDRTTLSTTNSYDSYQWFKDGALIPGATNRSYIVKENGEYQVAVSVGECVDTSAPYQVNNATDIHGIEENVHIKVYPNPSEDWVYIKSPQPIQVQLSTLEGKMLLQTFEASAVSLQSFPSGTYFLRIFDQENRLLKVEKLIKQ